MWNLVFVFNLESFLFLTVTKGLKNIYLKNIKSDTCGIWTHAPNGINLAG